MFKRATQHYGETPVPETPHMKAQALWDDRIGSARVQAANWRYAAFGAIAVALISVIGLIWQASRFEITPYIIEIDGKGKVTNLGPADEAYTPSDAVIAHNLANFIRNVRSVSIDPVVVRENWLKTYDYATDKGAMALNAYARENDPFTNIGRRSVNVEVTSVVRASSDSFEVRWTEQTFSDGQFERRDQFTAHLTIVLSPPRDAETLHKNPLGLYVHGLNWSKDLIAKDPS